MYTALMMFSARTTVLIVIAAVLATVLLIYLTPLKWITLIEPTVKDIDARAFETEFVAHPNDYIFLDVRQANAYDALHAPGAISMPLQNLYDEWKTLPRSGKTIVLICSDGRASGVGYSYLQHYGFFNIVRVGGGMESWIQEGLPVEGTSAASSTS
jgi:rhodanese-related sulfurtransferase